MQLNTPLRSHDYRPTDPPEFYNDELELRHDRMQDLEEEQIVYDSIQYPGRHGSY